MARRCRIKSHKITCVNQGVPGQHSCHVGERQGLKSDTNIDKFLNNLNLEITKVIHQQYTSKWNVTPPKLEKQYLRRWWAWLDSMETVSCKKSTFSFISHTHLILPKLRGPWTHLGAVKQDSVRYVMKNTALLNRSNSEILLEDWALHKHVG